MTQSLDMNGHDGDFDKLLKSPYIIKKNQKNREPSRSVILCDLVTRKNINLQFGSFSEKVFSETSYHERTCMAFMPTDQCYGHIHDIVCSNMLKFGTCVHNGTANNVAEQRFRHVSQKKSLFIF